MEENRQIMRALATAMNRIDQMYCDDVTGSGVKASELWLLYALDDGALPQKQICQEWGLPKTNTPEHHPEAGRSQGGIDPRPPHRGEAAGSGQICLTAAGQAYARQVLRPIYGAEDAPLQGHPWTGTGRRWWPPWWRPWITSAGACGTALPNKWRKRRTTTTHENLSAIFEALPGALPADPVGHGPGRGGGAVPAHHRGRHDQHRRGGGDLDFILRKGGLMLGVALVSGRGTLVGASCAPGSPPGSGGTCATPCTTSPLTFSASDFEGFGTGSMITRTLNDVNVVQQAFVWSVQMVLPVPPHVRHRVLMAFPSTTSWGCCSSASPWW